MNANHTADTILPIALLDMTNSSAFSVSNHHNRIVHSLMTVGVVVSAWMMTSLGFAQSQPQPDWGSIANPPPALQKRAMPQEVSPAQPFQEQPIREQSKEMIQKRHMESQWIPSPDLQPLQSSQHRPLAVPQPMPQFYLDEWEARERLFWEREAYRERVMQNNQRVVAILGDRQDAQLQRITDGVAQGRIARSEFIRLMTEQQKVRHSERQAMNDGMWTRPEYESALSQYDQIDRLIDRSLRRQPPAWGFNGQPQFR